MEDVYLTQFERRMFKEAKERFIDNKPMPPRDQRTLAQSFTPEQVEEVLKRRKIAGYGRITAP